MMKTKWYSRLSGLLLATFFFGWGISGTAAQETPMLDGTFQGIFPPAEWKLVNQGNAAAWGVYWGGGAVNSQNYTNVPSRENALNDAWLITPQLLPSEAAHVLKFYVSASSDTLYDNTVFDVLVSTASGSVADFFEEPVFSLKNQEAEPGFAKAWTEKQVDLSAYLDRPVFVAFRVRNNTRITVKLDEVSGLPLAVFGNDVRLNALLLDPSWVLFPGDKADIQGIVENRGTESADGVLSLTIGDEVQTQPYALDSGARDTVRFVRIFSTDGEYTLTMSLPADENTINDTIRQTFRIYPENTLMEDFHAAKDFPPKEWRVLVENSTMGITRATSKGASATPGYASYGQVYNIPVGKPVIRTLITPQLRPLADSRLQYSVSTGSSINSAFADSLRLYVLVSETGNDPADFTDTLSVYGVSGSTAPDILSSAFTEYTDELAPYAGKDIFVAFVVVDRKGVTSIYIDEIGEAIPFASFERDARVLMAGLADPHRYWFAGDEAKVLAVVDNYGSAALQDLKVSLKVNGNEAASQNIGINAGEVSDTLVFSFPIPEEGNYEFEVSVPDDDNAVNNSGGFALKSYPEGYFIEGFEGLTPATFPPEYWTCDMTTWGSKGWSLLTAQPWNGLGSAMSTANCRLITPRLHIGENDSLCFYAKTGWAANGGAVYAVLSSKDSRVWDTLVVDTLRSASYLLQKVFFTDQEPGFFGDRYFAFVTLLNNMEMDEVYGPMLSGRSDQFTLVLAQADPRTVAVAGNPASFMAVVYNDGAEIQSKKITLYADGEEIASASTRLLEAGEYDTVYMTATFETAAEALDFSMELPEDDYLFDNRIDFTTPIYEAGLWRFEEGFENTAHPFWLFSDANWTAKPSHQPLDPPAGENYLQRSFNGGNPALAVSPYMDLRFDEYEVSVDIYRNAAVADRPDRIELAFGAFPRWENIVFIDSVNRIASNYPAGEAGWKTYTFRVALEDLPSGFFMMRAINRTNAYGSASYEKMAFDNLVIRPVLAKDAELVRLSSPSDTVWGSDSVRTALQVFLRNNGEETLTAATLRYGAAGKECGTFEWKGRLASGKDTLLLLADRLVVPSGESFSVYAQVEVAGDENELTDRIEKEVFVKQAYILPFVAEFENPDWDKDWNNFTLSTDAKVWFRDTTGEFITAPFGKACANSASLDDELGAVHPDNWLVTPGLAIKYPKAYLSFYVKAADRQFFAEKFQVLVSARSDRDTAFFTPIHTETLTSDSLKHIVLELDGYKNETLHIAFRHFDCTDNYRLIIDSVYVYDPATYTVTVAADPEDAGTVEGVGTYMLDEEVVLTARPAAGYDFAAWYRSGSETPVSTDNPYRFTCTGNENFEVRFEKQEFAIVLQAGEGGSVSPADTVKVLYGEDLEVKITPDEGYAIDDVMVDGVPVGAVATYTFETVSSTHTLRATFKPEVANEALEVSVLNVRPNPFTTHLEVESDLPVETMRMVNMQGKTVLTMNLGGAKRFVLNPILPDGLYILVAESADGRRLLQRVVKVTK